MNIYFDRKSENLLARSLERMLAFCPKYSGAGEIGGLLRFVLMLVGRCFLEKPATTSIHREYKRC
jgi:hypothetical protein